MVDDVAYIVRPMTIVDKDTKTTCYTTIEMVMV